MDNGKLISCRALKERGEVKTAINRERVTSGALGLHDHGRSCRRIFGSVIRVLSGVAVCPRVRAARIPGGATADTPDPKKLYTDLYLSIGFCGYAEISGDIHMLKIVAIRELALSSDFAAASAKLSPRCLRYKNSPPGLIRQV